MWTVISDRMLNPIKVFLGVLCSLAGLGGVCTNLNDIAFNRAHQLSVSPYHLWLIVSGCIFGALIMLMGLWLVADPFFRTFVAARYSLANSRRYEIWQRVGSLLGWALVLLIGLFLLSGLIFMGFPRREG